jgi:hypothetical protein
MASVKIFIATLTSIFLLGSGQAASLHGGREIQLGKAKERQPPETPPEASNTTTS